MIGPVLLRWLFRDSVLASSIQNYVEMDSQETFTSPRCIQGYRYATDARYIQQRQRDLLSSRQKARDRYRGYIQYAVAVGSCFQW